MQKKEQQEAMLNALDLVTSFIASVETTDSLPEEYEYFVCRLQSYSAHIEEDCYNLIMDFVLSKFNEFSNGLHDVLPLSAMMGAVAEDDSLSTDWHFRELAEAEFTLKKAELLKAWYTFVIAHDLLNF